MWFNVNKEKEYAEMFGWLSEHDVLIGLHHWGLADGQYKTNLSTQHQTVHEETVAQMKRTIEIGAEIGAGYVNVHPGAQFLERIDFARDRQELVEDSETFSETAWQMLFQGTEELTSFAEKHGVLFTVETLPGREANNFEKREGMYDSGNPPLAVMVQLGKRGIALANDITHSASQLMLQYSEISGLHGALLAFTKEAAPFTRLLHINSIRPPFDGRDSHNGLLPEDFALGSFPNYEQLVELLSVFRGHQDVFAVVEPQLEKTRQNFLALKKIAEEAKVA